MSQRVKPEMVKSWGVEPGVGFVVNGRASPFYVAFEGPMVEPYPDDESAAVHLLWLPLIAEGPAPRAGRPDGEQATPATTGAGESGEVEA